MNNFSRIAKSILNGKKLKKKSDSSRIQKKTNLLETSVKVIKCIALRIELNIEYIEPEIDVEFFEKMDIKQNIYLASLYKLKDKNVNYKQKHEEYKELNEIDNLNSNEKVYLWWNWGEFPGKRTELTKDKTRKQESIQNENLQDNFSMLIEQKIRESWFSSIYNLIQLEKEFKREDNKKNIYKNKLFKRNIKFKKGKRKNKCLQYVSDIDKFQLSLCGELMEKNRYKNKIEFQINKITFEYFYRNLNLIFDDRLIILSGKILFPLRIDLNFYLSFLVFDQSFYENEFWKINIKESLRDIMIFNINDIRIKKMYTTNKHKNSFKRSKRNMFNYRKWIVILEKVTSKKIDQIIKKKRKTEKFTIRSIRPTNDMLKSLKLKYGRNTIKFSITSKLQGNQFVNATAYLWPHNKKIVISDVDGTITKSDVLGHLMPWVGSHWSHNGVAKFYTNIVKNGYSMLYVTSRAICHAELTRQYLFEIIEQHSSRLDKGTPFVLPEGPVIMAPDSLLGAFHREIIQKKPQDFKIPALKDIRNLFPNNVNPFFAAFGNRGSDLISYLSVGVPRKRCFVINSKGRVQSYNVSFKQTYETLSQFVNEIFIKRDSCKIKNKELLEKFSNLKFWKKYLLSISELVKSNV